MASCKQPRRSTRNYMPVAMEWKPINDDAAHTSKALHPTTRAECSSALPSKMSELQEEITCLKINSTRQKRDYEAAMKLEVDKLTKERKLLISTIQELEKQLDAVKIADDKHQTEKEMLIEQNRILKNDVWTMRVAITTLKKNSEAKMKTEVQKISKEREFLINQILEMQEELQAVKVAKATLQQNYEEQLKNEKKKHGDLLKFFINEKQALKNELEAVKVAKDTLQRNYEEQIKTEEKKHGDLLKLYMNQNQALKNELEVVKARGSTYNLQMIGDSSEPQQEEAEKDETAVQQKVSLASFHPIRVLGEGGFGKVLLAEKKSLDGSKELYALKMLKKTHVVSDRKVSFMMTEKEVLILASGHPFITTLHACFQTKDHLFFVLDFASGGDLKDQLRRLHIFSEERAKFYAAEVTLALQFLHKYGIVHRDLKLENVLLGADGHCKLADFGLSRLGMFRGAKANTYCGTPRYMAPEMVQRLPYGREVDWWGLGVIIYEMLTGQPPFYDSNRYRLERKIINANVMYPRWLSRQAALIISKLLKKDPSQRLGSHGHVNVIRQQPFFQGIDWNALKEKRIKPPDITDTLPETEEADLNLKDLLNPGNARCIINQEEFEGFSFINYGQLKAKPA